MTKSATREAADGELFKSTGIDDNATSTAVTIDASENVMVGQTSVNTANNGHSFGANGNYAHHTSTESTTLILNRKTSNGDIVRLRKDNAAVGSIGTLGGATYFGSADSGIMFNGVNQNPTNGTSTRVDNTNDLGASSYRYKDIYLGGGAFLGGTATANKLEDYETGTYTPVAKAGSTVISTTNQGTLYTKIGRQVNLSMYLIMGSSANISSISLPFTAVSGVNVRYAGAMASYNMPKSGNQYSPLIEQNSAVMGLWQMQNNTAAATTWSVDSNSEVFITITYFTDA